MTKETITSAGRMLRRSFNDQHDFVKFFWINQPTITFVALYFIMLAGIGCILHFELRPSVDTSTTTAESRPAQLVSAITPPLIDSLPPETLPSGHE